MTPSSIEQLRGLGPAPPASSDHARAVMLGNRSESSIERSLRSELHRRGMRFRKHVPVVAGLRCRPDVVFPRARLAVFVDGCFWHSCPTHSSQPRANAAWWKVKLDANVARDRRNDRVLRQEGWTVLRFWAHEEVVAMAERVGDALMDARASGKGHEDA